MAYTTEYPRVLYHTAIKHPRNIFGHVIKDAEPVFVGDDASPNYPLPEAGAADLEIKGRSVGPHLIPQHHYRTMLVVVYDTGGGVDIEASKAEEERLAKEGWVRHPSDLKEEYED